MNSRRRIAFPKAQDQRHNTITAEIYALRNGLQQSDFALQKSQAARVADGSFTTDASPLSVYSEAYGRHLWAKGIQSWLEADVEFEGMNETELANYISQKMVELGIEIVRYEESELSVLSST
jgi:hypothetical protein